MDGTAVNVDDNVVSAELVCMYHISPFHKNCRLLAAFSLFDYLLSLTSLFSQGWFATPHDVLQADWHDVWHSPQPPSFTLFSRFLVSRV